MSMLATFENSLVSTQWVESQLGAPDLRVLDCTTHLVPEPNHVFRVESGYADWEAGHVPGAGYVDLQGELSDSSAPFRFMLPATEQFAEVMGAKGVSPDSRVVLYSTTAPQWAARIWWMLRAFGFDNAMIMDGGFRKWASEGRTVSTEPCRYPSAVFEAAPREGVFVDKGAVLEAMDQPDAAVLNALSAAQHDGSDARHYGRPGRISGSINVPANDLLDPENGTYLPEADLRALFEPSGVMEKPAVVHYCGGGIAASSTAFILTLLGHPNVSVYDASLSEWAADAGLPMETG